MEKAENANRRITYIDMAKGFAILMVVTGHIAQYCIKGKSAESVFDFIYSFHMPLFFFLSGYVASLSRNKIELGQVWSFVQKKIRTLVLPFFIWGVVVYFLFQPAFTFEDVANRIIEVILKPDNNAPWFLITLFCIQIFFLLFCLFSNLFVNKKLAELGGAFLILIMIVGGYVVSKHFYYFNLFYNVAFFFGYFYKKIFDGEANRYLFIFLLLLFCQFSWRFDFSQSPNYMKLAIGSILSIIVIKIVKEVDNERSLICDKLKWIGRNTLEIYVVQCFGLILITEPIDVSTIHPICLFVILLSISVVLSIIIISVSKLLSKLPFVALLLFGKNDRVTK